MSDIDRYFSETPHDVGQCFMLAEEQALYGA